MCQKPLSKGFGQSGGRFSTSLWLTARIGVKLYRERAAVIKENI